MHNNKSSLNSQSNEDRIRILKHCASVLSQEKPGQCQLAYLISEYHRTTAARHQIESFGQPKLQRLCIRNKEKFEQAPLALEDPPGRIVRLFRRPSPTEQQARIAVEDVVEQWTDFLQQRHFCPTLVARETQSILFVPEGVEFDLSRLWEEFQRQHLFSHENLSRTLLPLLNISKLSARGFSSPEVLLVSPGMRDFMAAWFYRVFLHVQDRLEGRERELQGDGLTASERKKKQALQDKEIKKYQTHFARQMENLQTLMEKHQAKLEKNAASLDSLSSPSGARFDRLTAQRQQLLSEAPFPEEAWSRLASTAQSHEYDPFSTLRCEFEENPSVYREIIALSHQFTRTAADQLNHPRGDIFTAMLVDLLRIANLPEEQCQQPIPPLFSEQPFQTSWRIAGDDHKGFCYACGRSLAAKEASFETRRMVFTKPEQRLQSSAAPRKPPTCISCLAFSYASGVKPTDDGTLVKIEPQDLTLRETIRQMSRVLINKQLHVQAGPYFLLVCKEFEQAQGGPKPVSSTLGGMVYAYYRLASDLHPALFDHARIMLCHQGKETPLSNAALLWLRALIDASNMQLVAQGKLQAPFAKALRATVAGKWIEAEYMCAGQTSYESQFQRTLEPYREPLIRALHKEKSMSQQPLSTELERISAMTGLLSAYVESLKFWMEKEKEGEPEGATLRELAKLIEYCHDPIHWLNRYASQERISWRDAQLYKRPENHFIYKQAKTLLEALAEDGQEREVTEGDKTYLRIYGDDIYSAYNYLFPDDEKEYQRKEFTNKLRLSLYSRYPRVISRYKNRSQKGA